MMQLIVYVGPYLEVRDRKDISNELNEFESLILDGRGELGVGESIRFLIPNEDLKGVWREMHFSRDGGNYDPIDIPAISYECHRFKELVQPFVNRLRESEESVSFRYAWGVVCRYT